MIIHRLICDRCKAETNAEYTLSSMLFVGYFEYPKGWVKGKRDLCPKCHKQYTEHMEKFK